MINPQTFDFQAAKKVLFDGAVVGFNRDHISVAIATGPDIQVVAMTPPDAKAFVAMLAKCCAGYEIQFGPIKDPLAPTPSPIEL